MSYTLMVSTISVLKRVNGTLLLLVSQDPSVVWYIEREFLDSIVFVYDFDLCPELVKPKDVD